MKQAITLILAVYVIVYLVVTIYNKPNFEFFWEQIIFLMNLDM